MFEIPLKHGPHKEKIEGIELIVLIETTVLNT